ncbi:MAG: EAL domain-containing protein [Shinella sp.]|nr:EAL domain-containing protein [Shinella sp.]
MADLSSLKFRQDIPANASSLFGALFDKSAIGVALVDTKRQFIDANKAFLRPFGVQRWQELPDLELIFSEKDREILSYALNAAERGNPEEASWEVRLRRSDDSAFWALFSIAPVSDPAAPAFLIQAIDIDERKQHMLELVERENRWNHALKSAGQGVWDHDYARGRLYYSRQWRTMRGIEADEVVDASLETWIMTVHPDDRAHVLEEIRKQESGEAPFSIFSYRERHRDGRWIWIESRGAVVEYSANGKPAHVAGTDTDITERKEAEELLAQLSRRLELALDITRIGVFEANLQTGELQWDERMVQIYGRTAAPDSWPDSVHPDDRSEVVAIFEKALLAQKPFSYAFRIIRNDGEIRHIRARAVPYTDANGTPRVVGANWDVTEDVYLQDELKRSKELTEARNEELEAAKERIEYIAHHDHLTGLANRRLLDSQLEDLAVRSGRTDMSIAVLHIDLDRFKEINDTFGHLAGDQLLVHAADVLRRFAEPGDFVARIGGDEFVFLIPSARTRNLAELAEKIVDVMRQPIFFEGKICRFGASIGIAIENGRQIDVKQLLVKADLALYQAKDKGRNRHEFFSKEIHARVTAVKQIADEILTGIEQRRFVPFYQLQFDARTLDVVGVETLARWNHPTRGVLTPDAFLKAAEDVNMVATIDRLVLEAALADFSVWRRSGVAVPKISANVSSRRLHDPDLGRSLAGLEIPPGTLSFELLESIFLDDYDSVVTNNLEAIRNLGIELEVDDFGTGHASIISLMKLSPKRLKIDRQLIKPILQSPGQRKLVGTIIEIGHSLDIEVVAEGVETAKHALILRDLECDVLQGYALARPKPAAEIADFIKTASWRNRIVAGAHRAPKGKRQ